MAGQAKVTDACLPPTINEYVGGFEVAVHDGR